MVKRILVTGGAGFIGSHLCDALVAGGGEVVVIDSLVAASPDNLAGCMDRLTFIEDDIRTVDYQRIGRVDAVIHLAALISGYDSLADPNPYIDVNIGGTSRLIEYSKELGSPRIIFASSSTVYGSNSGLSVHEDVAPAPMSVYGLTKLAGEHLLNIYSPMKGYSHCTLRLFNVYGPRQDLNHPYANVTCKFSHAAATDGRVVLFGDGNQARDFIFIDDVVKSFLAVLEGSGDTVYNVGSGHDRRIGDLLEILGGIVGKPLAVDQRAAWPNDIRTISSDSRRIADEFGFLPTTGLEDGLTRTVGYYREMSNTELA